MGRRAGAGSLLLVGVFGLCLALPGAAFLVHPALAADSVSGSAPGLVALLDASGPPSGATLQRPLASGQEVDLEIGLSPSDPTGLAAFDASLQDPSSPLYHHFLSNTEYLQRFGPSTGARSAVSAFLSARHASSISWSSDGLTVNAELSAAQVADAFGSSLGWYQTPAGGHEYAPTGTPSLPPGLAGEVTGIEGLTDAGNPGLELSLVREASLQEPSGTSVARGVASYDNVNNGQQVFWGTDFDGAFDALNMINAGHNGAGYSVDTILWSGYNATDGIALPPWDPTAVNDYFTQTFPSGWTPPIPSPQTVVVGGNVPPQPGASSLGDDVGGQLENSLDLEMVGSTAPGASLYCFYFSGAALNTNNLGSLYGDFDQALSAALGFSYPHPLAAISNSYGLPDENDTVWDGLLETAEAQGVSLLASSGDAGDAPVADTGRPQGQWPGWPATAAYQDWGVTAVGGSAITVSGTPCGATWGGVGSGQLPQMCYGAGTITGLSTDQVWYQNVTGPDGTAGSEGGISAIYNEPQWQADSAAQSAIELAAPKEGLLYARGVPDLSSVAQAVIIYTSSTPSLSGADVAGTSAASPVMAGFVADLDGDLGSPQGFLDPDLYDIGSYFLTQSPGSPADPFGGAHDTSPGAGDGNWVFNASVGWSAVSGWGCPDLQLLAQALTNPTYTHFVYNPSAVAGKAGPAPISPAPSQTSLDFLVFLAAIALIGVVFVVLVLVGYRRRAAARAVAGPMPPPAPTYGYPSPPGGYSAPGYGPAYGTPTPPAATYGGYPAVVYANPPPSAYASPPPAAYGTPPSAVYPAYGGPAAPPPVVACRYCHHPRPNNFSPCPTCGGPA
jgi:subtilase family serine protease